MSGIARTQEIDPDQVSRAKSNLRQIYLKRRDNVRQDIRLALAANLAREGRRLCADFAREGGVATASAYSSIGSEADSGPLLSALHADGWTLCLPVDESPGGPLVYRRWSPNDRLAAGPLGILEPVDRADEVEPDVMFVPVIAFDQSGNRLGYGAGNVDSTLRKLRRRKRLKVVGVAFSVQEEISVPTAPNDEPVDFIITESEVIRCRA